MTYCELFKSSGVSYESQDGGARPHRPSPEAPGGLLSAPPASPAAGEPRACAPRAAPPQHGGGRRLLLNDVKAPGGVTTAAGWRPLGTGAGESRGGGRGRWGWAGTGGASCVRSAGAVPPAGPARGSPGGRAPPRAPLWLFIPPPGNEVGASRRGVAGVVLRGSRGRSGAAVPVPVAGRLLSRCHVKRQ